MGNPRSTKKLLDHCLTKADVAANPQYAWDLIGIGVDPGRRYVQESRSLLCLEQAVEASEPLFYCAATKTIVAPEAFEPRDLLSVTTNPGNGSSQDVGHVTVRKKR